MTICSMAMEAGARFEEALEYEFVGRHAGSAINLQLVQTATEPERTVHMRIQVTSYEALCLVLETRLAWACCRKPWQGAMWALWASCV
ncbi:MAG: hypothetical protein JNJ60_10410 [Rhodocyclaceae bacterium]|nr:hypothetical protein [Rhodocyclaceae bacterium]